LIVGCLNEFSGPKSCQFTLMNEMNEVDPFFWYFLYAAYDMIS